MSDWMDALSEADENRLEVSNRWLSHEAFKDRVRNERELRPTAFLSLQFPLGSIVVAEGLSAAELNGKEAEVTQFSRDRVGVTYPDRGVVALKPERLRLLSEPQALEEPAAKKQDTGEEKLRRQKEVERQEALAIARRFVECLFEDTFPEMGDLHLFGVGTSYHARAQEVLAVWQGAAKHMDLKVEDLADALERGSMPQFFEETCKKLADSKTPNSPYAVQLIRNNYAAVEWDTLT